MDGWEECPSGWNKFTVDLSYENKRLTDYTQDTIMVLAGGLDNHGDNHPWVKDRLDLAIQLYKEKARKIIILGGGTYHKKPLLNVEKFVMHESTVGAKYLIDKGVDSKDIYREWGSYDTIANGMFSLTNFSIPMDIRDILVITSDFHMPRAKEIFKWIYGLWYKEKQIKLDFLETNSDYLDTDLIESRKSRESRSLETLKETIERIDNWGKFHEWFYMEHKAYNCEFGEKRVKIDLKASMTY